MKRLLLVPCLLLAALAVPVSVAAPAHAKGATKVVVEGPGMDPVKLRQYTRRTDDVDLGLLSEVTSIYGIFGSGTYTTEAPDLTEAQLGPRYDLTWYQASDVMVVSHVYPFAEGGAWTVVPEGQTLWGEPMQTGWWHAGTPLEDAMVELGATPRAGGEPGGSTDAAATTSDASDDQAAAVSLTDDPGSGSGAVTGVLAAGVALVLAAGVWLVRRRRTLQPA